MIVKFLSSFKPADSLDFESAIKIREHMKRLQARIDSSNTSDSQ
ncbi:MAG: hypothetical protein NTV63_00305 [Candidatus Woesearchaeota archaeon]|nr:hypothetical protein [Candidatus Woesearchaeota archaeon]